MTGLDDLRRVRADFPTYARLALKVKAKAPPGAAVTPIVPFVLNSAQQHAHRLIEAQRERVGYVRAIILKGRQQGISTYVEGRYYWRVSGAFGLSAMILTHKQDATDTLFGMVQRYHNHCPSVLRPSTTRSNAKELKFDKLDSGYKVATAGGTGSGRSDTAQLFHASEMAHWPSVEENWAGVGQIVPSGRGTEIIVESTANGLGNRFHKLWTSAIRGESDYIPIFIPWFWQTEYRRDPPSDFAPTEAEAKLAQLYKLEPGQLYWRRRKIGDDFGGDEDWFKQEYPCTPEEAFVAVGTDPYIRPADVNEAKPGVRPDPERFGARVIGIDPARFGNDATAIIRRQGRVAYGLHREWKKDTMHVAGITARIIEEEQPDAVFIDIGGLGAGIYDRLRELGHAGIVRPVNFGEAAYANDRYLNRRAEMWGGMRDWLRTPGGVLIPADDGLYADLIGPQYSYTSSSQLQLESKESMRRRQVDSPDAGDALGLTFAEPVAPRGHDGRPLKTWRDKLNELGRPRKTGMTA